MKPKIKSFKIEKKDCVPYRVIVQAPYAADVEFGRLPYVPSGEEELKLKKWVEQKVFDSQGKPEDVESFFNYLIEKIKKIGTNPHPYLFPALDYIDSKSSTHVFDDLQEVAESIAYYADMNIQGRGTNGSNYVIQYNGFLASSIITEEAPDLKIKQSNNNIESPPETEERQE